MSNNTMNPQSNISNFDQDIDQNDQLLVLDAVEILNIDNSQVYTRLTSCKNSEGSEDNAQEIGEKHDEIDENSPSPTAARKISVATRNYTEESTNDMAEGAAHPVSSSNIEYIAKEIGNGQNEKFEFPINTSDTDITQADKIEGVQQQKTKATVSSVSSVFKDILFWPVLNEVNSKETINVRRRKEKVPAVVSSLQWKQYYKEKENKKQEVLLQKEERKRKREEKAREALEVKRKKQEAKEEKQRIAKKAKKAQKVQDAEGQKVSRKTSQKKTARKTTQK